MAVNDNPAQGGNINSTSGSVTDSTTTDGNGGGVQLTNVNNANDQTRTSIVGVTINNTSGAPTANALDIEASNPGGAAAIFNGAYNIPYGATPAPGATYPNATNILTTTVSGGAAFNEVSNANAGNQLYGTNDFTGSYGAKLAAPSGFVVWNLNGAGTENFVANKTAVAGIYETAGASSANVTATQGTINISGFATGISLSGNGASIDTTGGGTISGATTGMNVDGKAGATTITSGSAITDSGIGIRAVTSGAGSVSVTTTSTGTIDGGTVGIFASGAAGTSTTTVVVGAAIGSTTAPTTAGVEASATGSGAISITANASVTGAASGDGIALLPNGTGNTVTVANGVTVQGGVGLEVSGGTTTLSNSGTIASTTGGNAIQIDSGTLSIGNNAGTINGAIADAGALAFTNTAASAISSAITGAGTVAQTGAGTTTLSGTNTYTGGTTLAAGTLAVSADAKLGGTAGGLAFTGGTLDATSGFSSARAVTLNSTGTVQVDAGTLTLSGAVANGTGGAGSLTKTGAGTLTLTGTESYTGGTTISGGTLQVGDGTAAGSVASLGTGAVTDNAALVLNRVGTTAFANNVSGTGSLTVKGVGAGNTETLSGALTQTGGFTVADASNVTLTGSYGSATTPAGASLTLNGGTFTNAGSVYSLAPSQGVVENVAGTFINQSGAIVSGGNNAISILATTGTALVDNAGTLIGRAFDGVAKANYATSNLDLINRSTGVIVSQDSGGTNGYGVFTRAGTVNVTNNGGKIVGRHDGVALLNSATGAIVNAGTIASGSYDTGTGAITVAVDGVDGVLLQAGGTVTNTTTGTIEGATHGLESDAGSLNLSNAGTILGTSSDGVVTTGSATVLNTGTLQSNTNSGIASGGGSLTVTNAASGKLTGGNSTTYGYGFQVNGAAGTLNNYGSATGSQGGILALNNGAVTANLYAGSTTGNIALGGGNDTVSLYTGAVTTSADTATDPVSGATTTERAAGTYVSASVGTIALGSGTNALNLRGMGDGAANGAIGTVDLHGVTGATTVNKSDSGTFQLTESAAGAGSAGATVNAGNGGTPGSGGLLQFNGTADLTGSINVNGAKIQAQTAGAFGSGTINAIDPTIEYSANGTYSNPISLQAANPATDPVRLEADSGVTATLSGAITQASRSPAQQVVFDGGGTVALTNTGNAWTGGTTISGGTLQIGDGNTTGSIQGNVVDGGTLAFDEAADTPLSFAGAIMDNGGTAGAVTQLGGTTVLSGNNTFTGGTTISGGTLQIGDGATSGSIQGDVIDNATLAFDPGTANGSFSGNVSGTGTVVKIGGNTETLSGTNSYMGATLVSAGTLKAGSASAFGTNSAVTDNATLDLAGFNETIGSLSGSAAGIVTNSGPLAATLTTGTLNANVAFAGTIQDGTALGATTALTKTGTGTLTLTGAGTYTGGTTVSAGGTLQLGDGTTSGTISAASAVIDNGTLAFDHSNALAFANTISGSGAVTQIGGGTTTLSAAQGYTGATTIAAGTLALTDAGSVAASSVVADNAVLDISGTTDGASVTTLSGTTPSATVVLGAKTLTVTNGSTIFRGAINGTGGLSITGGTETLTGTNGYMGATSIATGSTLRIGNFGTSGSIASTSGIADNGTLEFSNYGITTATQVISGAGALTQDGLFSTLVLTAADTYTGATTIASGSTLQLGNGGTTGSILATSGIADTGTLSFDRSDSVTFDRAVTGSGGLSQIGSGTLTLTTAQTYTGATTIASGTTLQLGDGGTAGSIATTSGIADAGTLAVNQSGTLTLGKVISGAGTLTVAGGGSTVLSAANTYTGGTTILAGTLEIGANGSAGTGAITYAAGREALVIDGAVANGATYANTLAGFGIGDTLDLAGLGFAAGATATLSNGTLTVTSGSISENFTLSNAGTSGFAASADGNGGTLITAYAAPTITGTVAGQTTQSEVPVAPFSGVTVTDPNAGTDTLTIALSGGGGTLTGAGAANPDGTYTLTGSDAAITAQLDAVTFTPAAGEPNTVTTTSFTLTDVSSLTPAATATDSTTTVTDTDPAVAPVIVGTMGGQMTAAEASVMPFASATVTDRNAGATDALTIALSGGGGTLSGAGLSQNPDGSYSLAATDPGTLTAELEALSFTPTNGTPGAAATTVFTLTDLSSAGTAASDATTSVTDTAAAAPVPTPAPAPAPTPQPAPAPVTSPPMVPGAVSINQAVTYDHGTFNLSGTASSAAGVKSVEISAVLNYGERVDLGAATVNTDGTFTFEDKIGANLQGFLQATETDNAGGTATSADPLFSLTGGLGPEYGAGRQRTYTDGGKTIASVSQFRAGGSRQVDVQVSGLTFTSDVFDTFKNNAVPESTFVFNPGFGRDVVDLFRVNGTDHDTLSLKGTDFGNSIATVLQNTYNAKGGAVIYDPTSGDTVKLVGINKHQLAVNQGDFALHA